jgi:hypothetical protein
MVHGDRRGIFSYDGSLEYDHRLNTDSDINSDLSCSTAIRLSKDTSTINLVFSFPHSPAPCVLDSMHRRCHTIEVRQCTA